MRVPPSRQSDEEGRSYRSAEKSDNEGEAVGSEMADKRVHRLGRSLRSQSLRRTVTFLITVRSPEVVIRVAIIPPKYSRHESSIRDVEIACTISAPVYPPRVTRLRGIRRTPARWFQQLVLMMVSPSADQKTEDALRRFETV